VPDDQYFEKTIPLPMSYVFVAWIRPATIKRTAIRLLPWALVAMLPGKRQTKVAAAIARRLSPLYRYAIK
jgi:lipopolysaccharide biosynthesis protein